MNTKENVQIEYGHGKRMKVRIVGRERRQDGLMSAF